MVQTWDWEDINFQFFKSEYGLNMNWKVKINVKKMNNCERKKNAYHLLFETDEVQIYQCITTFVKITKVLLLETKANEIVV